MNTRSKILIVLFLCCAAASILATFHRYIVLEDFGFYTNEDEFQAALLEE